MMDSPPQNHEGNHYDDVTNGMNNGTPDGQPQQFSEMMDLNVYEDDDDETLHRKLIAAKIARKRAEEDHKLLSNRIQLLRQEEQKVKISSNNLRYPFSNGLKFNWLSIREIWQELFIQRFYRHGRKLRRLKSVRRISSHSASVIRSTRL